MSRICFSGILQARKPQLFFDNLFTAALLVTTAYNVVLWLAGQICALPLLAAGFQWLVVLTFLGTGFAGLEGELLAKGNISPERARRVFASQPADAGLVRDPLARFLLVPGSDEGVRHAPGLPLARSNGKQVT